MENVRRNAAAFREKSGAKLCAVVKADAYGHGAEEVAYALADQVDFFAVALIDEGLAIRTAACGKGILVLTPPVTEEECYALAAYGLIATVPNLYTAKLLLQTCAKYRLRVRVHLKVNTGMNRYGMNPSALGKACKLFQGSEYVRVEGLYSHLYRYTPSTARKQRALFLQMQGICKRYFSSFISHLGGTYAALLGREYAFDAVRVGIGLYGYSPIKTDLPLRRAMTVYARVTDNRRYAFGGIGYGSPKKGTQKKGAPLSLLRVGYADGFLRRRENGADGYEKNANNLCMDGCIRVDKARRGKWVAILTDADETARVTGTIPYEVLCAVARRAERRYI